MQNVKSNRATNLKPNVESNTMPVIGSVDYMPDWFGKPATMVIPTVVWADSTAKVVANGADYKRPTGKKYYVSTSGSDANDGLTPGAPLKTIYTASQKADVDEVIIEAGFYDRGDCLHHTPTRDISFICESGECIFAAWEDLSWAADAGYTNLYKAARSTVWSVRDKTVLNSYGLYTKYQEAVSAAAADGIPGSWYTDGTDVWVHDLSSGAVSNATHVAIMNTKAATLQDVSAYFENITFMGGGKCFQSYNPGATRQRIGLKNCNIYYSKDDGCEIQGNVDTIFENCICADNELDGYNYHLSGAYIPTAVEINCKGYANGNGLVNTNNGSTGHDGMHVARFGGEYYDNHGPNVVDINDSFSWNVRLHAHDSTAPANNYDYDIDGTMWLYNCTGGTANIVSGTMYMTTGTEITTSIISGSFEFIG